MVFIFVNDFPHFIALNFHQPNSTMDEMNIQNPEPNYGHFWNVNTTWKFVSYSWYQHENFFGNIS